MRALERNSVVVAVVTALSAVMVFVTLAVEPVIATAGARSPAEIAAILAAAALSLIVFALRFRLGVGWSFALIIVIDLVCLAIFGERPAGVAPPLFAITVSLCRRMPPRTSVLFVAAFIVCDGLIQVARGAGSVDAERVGLDVPAEVILPILLFNVVFNSAVPAAAGWWMRTNDARVRSQAELVDATNRSRDLAVAEAVLKERGRMARELHDVAAHHLTAVAVSARALERCDDEATTVGLREQILSHTDEAMESMNDVITVLRDPNSSDSTGEVAPQESAGDLPELFDRVRQRGLLTVAEVNVDLTDMDLPVSTSHAVYRIVQEALTNAERHAPGASLSAEITADPAAQCVRILVRNTAGTAPGESLEGAGLGLLGMRERAELLGGELSAQPSSNGFTVRASLPLKRGEQR